MRLSPKNTVYEMVKEGALSDDELLKALNKGGNTCSQRDLDNLLLAMEIEGLISVTTQPKGRKRVEIARRGAGRGYDTLK